jgi:predicted aldo/keto reductase-like oxidoreductase
MSASAVHAELPYRVLGSTGERVSAIGLGGWHLGFKQVDEQLSIHIVRSAIDRGINTGPARSGWARRSATVTGTEHS